MTVGVMASAVHIAGGASAYPLIASTNTETGTNLGTANPMPSPSGVAVGNLLLAFCTSDSVTTITASTGWTEIIQTVVTTQHMMALFARIADGSANDSLAVTGAAQDYCVGILRVTDHGVTTLTTDIKKASAVATTGVINPPSLDAGSVKKWLWLTAAGLDQIAANQITAPPTNYTTAHTILSSAAGTSSALGVASRNLEIQTEDPGGWSNSSRPWIGFTVAIPPAP